MYAEQVTVIDDRETTVELELELLPPLEHRLGLLMLAAGSDARVLEPEDLAGCSRPGAAAGGPPRDPMRA